MRGSSLASDRGTAMHFDINAEESTRHYVYVDNLGILSTDPDLVHEGMQEVKTVFESQSLRRGALGVRESFGL